MRSSGNPGIYLLTLFFIFIECRLLQSQTYKHLDQFTSDTYFPAFIEGNGAVKDTVINHLGLRVDYKFDAGDHASFTILRNYDIAPQDCSFMPDRFTITVKG